MWCTVSTAAANAFQVANQAMPQTRSGTIFAQWCGPTTPPFVTRFDLPAALKLALQHDVGEDFKPADSEPTYEKSPPPAVYLPDATPSPELPTNQPPKRARASGTKAEETAKKQRFANGTAKQETEAQAIRRAAKKQRSRSREHCRKLRAELNEAAFSRYGVRPAVARKHLDPAQALKTTMEAASAPVASTAYVGLNDCQTRNSHSAGLDELVGEGSRYGFKYIPWDGKLSHRASFMLR